jgi:hypothetical protein
VRKLDKIALAVFLATLCVCSLLAARGVRAKSVKLNVRDLPEHGLRLIPPTDAKYPNEVTKFAFPQDMKQKRLIEATTPFSVILSNQSGRELVAYRVRWDSIGPDGTLTTHVSTYGEPGKLMGMTSNTGDSLVPGVAIPGESSRYVSIVCTAGEAQTGGITVGMGGGRDLNNISQVAQKASEHDTALIDQLGAELLRAESMTVTLDAAIFNDGSFVGPDSLGYFDQMQSLIKAKRDLLEAALSGAQDDRAMNRVYKDLEGLVQNNGSKGPPESRNSSEYYTFYQKQFAKEILRIREATGDDRKALSSVTRPLHHRWPTLHRPS